MPPTHNETGPPAGRRPPVRLLCAVCRNAEADRFRTRYVRPGFRVEECLDCGFLFIPAAYRKDVDYRSYKSADAARAVAASDEWMKIQRNLLRFERIRRYHASGRVFDAGCGFGHFLLTAARLGYSVEGVEMNRASAAFCRGRLGLPVRSGDFMKVPERPLRDVITLWDVLEHMDGPDRVVAKAARMLAPGGCLWIQVPRADSVLARRLGASWWALGPDHANYFTGDSLARLLARHGLEVTETRSSIELKNLLLYVILPRLARRAAGRGAAPLTAADRQSAFNRMTRGPSWARRLLVALHNALYRTLSLLGIGDEMIVAARKPPDPAGTGRGAGRPPRPGRGVLPAS